MTFTTYKEVLEAFPEDALCGFCGSENDWDEDGFFYLWPEPDMSFDEGIPACKECREGEFGRKHEELHGEGDEGR